MDLWMFWEVFGRHWGGLGSHGFPWDPRDPMGFPGAGIPWVPTGSQGPHGIPWDPRDSKNQKSDFHVIHRTGTSIPCSGMIFEPDFMR